MRKRVRAAWQTARGVDAVLEQWLESRVVRPCFSADETVARRGARMAPFPSDLPTPIAFALRGRDIAELYEHHQIDAESVVGAALDLLDR